MGLKVYALYKGDKYITSGTKKELADYLGVKVDTITFYMSPTYEKRGKDNRKKVIRIY